MAIRGQGPLLRNILYWKEVVLHYLTAGMQIGGNCVNPAPGANGDGMKGAEKRNRNPDVQPWRRRA